MSIVKKKHVMWISYVLGMIQTKLTRKTRVGQRLWLQGVPRSRLANRCDASPHLAQVVHATRCDASRI